MPKIGVGPNLKNETANYDFKLEDIAGWSEVAFPCLTAYLNSSVRGSSLPPVKLPALYLALPGECP